MLNIKVAAAALSAAFLMISAQEKTEEMHRSACMQNDASAHVFGEYGVFLRSQGRYQEACEQFARAIERDPQSLDWRMAWAYLYTMIGDHKNGLRVYNDLLKIVPNNSTVLYNCGYILKSCNYPEEALEYYYKSLAVNPDNDMTHFAIARTYIQMGNLQEGWKWYERYLKQSGRNAEKLRALLAQDAVAGKTILLAPEGSFGDVIQFIRYGYVLKNKGARVLAVVHSPLMSILSRCPFIDGLYTFGQSVPEHDASVHMMSAPAIFNDDLVTLPKEVPYIFPKPELYEYWREQLQHDQGFKVGLCWQADLHNDSSRMPIAHRGIPLEKLLFLQSIPGITFYSLQQKDGVEQLEQLRGRMSIRSFSGDFDQSHGRFEDTAALIAHMDLIITVDTSIAHLAGAMGRPVLLMLPYSTDWRWLFHRTDSPWYPTMKIFQQPAPFEWDAVVGDIYKELSCRFSRV